MILDPSKRSLYGNPKIIKMAIILNFHGLSKNLVNLGGEHKSRGYE
jgi:hypothetical protein